MRFGPSWKASRENRIPSIANIGLRENFIPQDLGGKMPDRQSEVKTECSDDVHMYGPWTSDADTYLGLMTILPKFSSPGLVAWNLVGTIYLHYLFLLSLGSPSNPATVVDSRNNTVDYQSIGYSSTCPGTFLSLFPVLILFKQS